MLTNRLFHSFQFAFREIRLMFTAAVFLGWLVLHEKIDAYILAGSAVVITSVVLVTSASVTKTARQLTAAEASAD